MNPFQTSALVVATLAVFACELPALADSYFAGLKSVGIGSGIDPSSPTVGRQPCVKLGAIVPIDSDHPNQTAQNATLRMTEVKSDRDMYEKLGFSANMSARYMALSAHGDFSQTDEHAVSTHSVSWVMYAGVDFGDVKMQGTGDGGSYELNPKAQRLIDSGKPEDMERFAKMCGTEYVTSEHRGAMVYAKYTLLDSDETTRKKLSALLSASASFPIGGGSFNSSVSRELTDLLHNKRIEVEVNVVGGDGVKTISKLVTSGTDLNAVKSQIQEHLASLKAENAAPMSYTTAPMEGFGWEPTHRTNELARYTAKLDSLMESRDHLIRLLNPANAEDQDALSLEDIQYYVDQLKTVDSQLSALDVDLEKCSEAATACNSARIKGVSVSWPSLGCGLPNCSRCNANRECTRCAFAPAADFSQGLSLGLQQSVSMFCGGMPAGKPLQVTAEGPIHNSAGFGPDNGFSGWQLQLVLGIDNGGSTENSDLWQGAPNARDRFLSMPPLATTVPSDGRVRISLKNVNSAIWPTVTTTVQLLPSWVVTATVQDDQTPDGWRLYEKLQQDARSRSGQDRGGLADQTIDQDRSGQKSTTDRPIGSPTVPRAGGTAHRIGS